jgi:hypothetical protein
MWKLLDRPLIGAWLITMSVLAAPAGAAPQ